ncbi:hypothetical protein QP028_11405 [Corynebacterium suedekumii]|nr:hypothetical protein QP028_11405 [Corynebacterium suedekumii]
MPTNIFLNLRAPQLAKVAEMLSVLPLVISAVALVSGVSQFYRAVAPAFINSLWSLVPLYVILSMPLCYRAIDAGVEGTGPAHPLRRQLPPSARAPGPPSSVSSCPTCGWPCCRPRCCRWRCAWRSTPWRPCCCTTRFPVFLVEVSNNNPRGIAALSFITIIITWLLLVAISAMSRADRATDTATDKVRKN